LCNLSVFFSKKRKGAQAHSTTGTAKHPTKNVKERPKGANSQHRFFVAKLGGFMVETCRKSKFDFYIILKFSYF
jgi:hypothetical protein